jgi:hypothetical protein
VLVHQRKAQLARSKWSCDGVDTTAL